MKEFGSRPADFRDLIHFVDMHETNWSKDEQIHETDSILFLCLPLSFLEYFLQHIHGPRKLNTQNDAIFEAGDTFSKAHHFCMPPSQPASTFPKKLPVRPWK